MTEPVRYGKWEVVEFIDQGGQGQVYQVRDASDTLHRSERRKVLQKAITVFSGIAGESDTENAASLFADEVRRIMAEAEAPKGALKRLLPIEESAAEDEAAAHARMKRELSTLESVDHPALVKVLDRNLDEKWFVMEFFEGGTLLAHLDKYKGRVLHALTALRPIVEAVSALHAKKVVHRDIKPDNIFVASDGHLVLADCGLAFRLENQERLTLTFENVGTRDFQPPWSYGMRLEDVQPTFDVFSLAKVLWAMVSGRPKFPLWYFDRDQNDLRQMFPEEPAIQFVHEILRKCVVESESETKVNGAAELLAEVDTTISAISSGCQVPGWKRRMRCRFCGIGTYERSESYPIVGNLRTSHDQNYVVCNHCGHVELFVWPSGNPLPAWNEDN